MTGKKEAMQLSKSTSISMFDRGFPGGLLKVCFRIQHGYLGYYILMFESCMHPLHRNSYFTV